MKPKLKILLVFISSLFLISCDPPHYIDFVNNTNSNVKVKLNIKPKTENYDLKNLQIGDSIVYNLKQNETVRIEFGIGNWSDKEIDEIVNEIKNIEIETNEVKTIYKTKKSIKSLLENNRKGILVRSKIEIQIK